MKRSTATTAASHDAYPLRTVSKLTGLSPDIIRAWEKRYHVVAPIRGARGARLYSAADIDHLSLLARAVGGGRAIGDVARLTRAQLARLGAQPAAEAPESRDGLVGRVMDCLERFDHGGVGRLLGDALIGLGLRAFVHQVASPLLRQVGDRWSDGKLQIADEHLFSGILRNLMTSLIQARVRSGAPVAVLAAPAGERHEFGLLLAALLALDAGLEVSYLGADLPAKEIVGAARRSNAALLGVSVVGADNRATAIGEVKAIQHALPDGVELWLGGREAAAVAAQIKPFRGLVVDDLVRAESELARIAATGRYNVNRRIDASSESTA